MNDVHYFCPHTINYYRSICGSDGETVKTVEDGIQKAVTTWLYVTRVDPNKITCKTCRILTHIDPLTPRKTKKSV